MNSSARDYLLNRFQSDAETLQARALSLEGGATAAGPDAATSRRMAQACRDVVHLLGAIPPSPDGEREFEVLGALIPVFELRAQAEIATPAVRAVHMGAATRIREILVAESRVGVEHDIAAADAAADDDAGDDSADDDDEHR